ncbi:MAG: GtrA family protein [Butyricicoccus sp.]|nr:GtrA family protein [Butyricicoccus sp.]
MKKYWDRLWQSSLVRFGLVGVLNTVVGTGIMFVMYNAFHFSYWLSSFANYFFGSILSFFLNKHFTFRSKSRSFKEVVRFVINIAVCYLLAYGISKPLMLSLLSGRSQAFSENMAMLTGMVLFVALNYLGQRFFTFRKSGEEN